MGRSSHLGSQYHLAEQLRIYNRSIKKTVQKVPLLGDIPGVGVLFRNTTNTNTKKELLIFVTPKIVTGNL